MNPLTNRWGLLATALTIIALGGALVLILVPAPRSPLETATSTPTGTTIGGQAATSTGSQDMSDLIVVDSPLPGATVSSSTVTITGEARGSWYFEGVFPIDVYNKGGTLVGHGQARAQSNWMTADFVPFSATIPITSYATDGTPMEADIHLMNDNPSGDPAKQKEVVVPVTFTVPAR